MGKVVKAVIGFAVAIGMIVAGVITGNPQLIISGIAIGLSTLKSLKGPKVSPSTTDRLSTSIDPRTARKGVFGNTAMNTDIRDEEYTGSDKEYFHRFVVCASHKATSIGSIYFDDKLAWTLAGGVQGDFAGYLTVDIVLEGSAANALNISSRMGSTRRYTGCAYVHFRYKLTGNSKKAESPFSSSVPTRVTIIGEGMPVYDPRYDSTVAGGSGSARANDQTTWQYSYSGSASGRNPACQALTYLLGWRIQNPVTSAWKLALGKGMPSGRIDLPSFITAANLCDEAVTLAVGGTEPRYRSDGVFSEFDQATDVLDNLKAAMSGELDDMDGLIRLTVLHNDLAVPVLEITADDVLGEFEWVPFASLDMTRNVIRGSFVDPSPQSLYQLIPYPDVVIDTPDGIERAEPVTFAFVQSASQAQRLAKQRLQRAQYAGTFTAEFKSRLWRAQKGDVVEFTFGPAALDAALFRIVDMTVQVDGRVPVVLRQEHADIYLWDADERPAVVPVDTSPYTNFDLPIVQALQDLETLGIVGYLTNESHTVPASSAGVVSTYAGAGGAFIVLQGGADISDQFTLSTVSGGNVQNLTVTYNNASDPRTYTISGAGTGSGEFGNGSVDGAVLTIRATGSGDFTGIIIDRVFSIAKSRAGVAGTPGTPGSPGAPGSDGDDGDDGADAKLLFIISNRQTIAYSGADAPTPTTQTTTFTAQKQNTTGTVTWSVTDAAGTAKTPTTDFLSAATGDTVTMTEPQFAAARGSTSGVIVTGTLTDGVTLTDKISVTKVRSGADGVSPISVQPSPISLTVQLNADGSVKSGQLPQAVANAATQGAGSVTIDDVTVTGENACDAVVSGTDVQLTSISGDQGSFTYEVEAAGQTVPITIPFTTARDGASGSVAQSLALGFTMTWSSYTQHGGTLAVNASSTGKLRLNLTGAVKTALHGFLNFNSKIQISVAGSGTWTDVSGSEHLSTNSEELSEPTIQTGANVNGSGPYDVTGLTASGAYLVRAMTKKNNAGYDNPVSGGLQLYAEQIA